MGYFLNPDLERACQRVDALLSKAQGELGAIRTTINDRHKAISQLTKKQEADVKTMRDLEVEVRSLTAALRELRGGSRGRF